MNPSEQGSSQWLTHRAFGGLDWASQSHAIVIVDAQGRVVEDFQIEHSALGWKKFRERLRPFGSIPFAVETNQGAAGRQAPNGQERFALSDLLVHYTPYSRDRAEGRIHKLKRTERQMYGRSNFDLLRHRVLLAA